MLLSAVLPCPAFPCPAPLNSNPLYLTLPCPTPLHSNLPSLLNSTILYHTSLPYLLCALPYPILHPPPFPYSTPLMSLHSTLPSPLLHHTLTIPPSPTPLYCPLPFSLLYPTMPFTLPNPTPHYPTIPCPTPLYPIPCSSPDLPFTVLYSTIVSPSLLCLPIYCTIPGPYSTPLYPPLPFYLNLDLLP